MTRATVQCGPNGAPFCGALSIHDRTNYSGYDPDRPIELIVREQGVEEGDEKSGRPITMQMGIADVLELIGELSGVLADDARKKSLISN